MIINIDNPETLRGRKEGDSGEAIYEERRERGTLMHAMHMYYFVYISCLPPLAHSSSSISSFLPSSSPYLGGGGGSVGGGGGWEEPVSLEQE